MSQGRGLVEEIYLCVDDSEGSLWAFTKTGAQTVTVLLSHETGLAAHDPDRPFGAGGNAKSAARAFLLVNMDDLALYFHRLSPFLFRVLFRKLSEAPSPAL